MKGVKSWLAGGLLLLGLPLSLLALTKLSNRTLPPSERNEVVAALVLFGLSPSALGTYLLWDARRQWQLRQRDRLHATFFQLLQTGQGQVSALELAMAAGISGTAATAYLDERAREFNATFDVSEMGGIFYQFPLSPALPTLEFSPSFDVILEAVPEEYRLATIHTLQTLPGLTREKAEVMIQRVPITLCRGVSQAEAIAIRQQFQAIGATITLSLN